MYYSSHKIHDDDFENKQARNLKFWDKYIRIYCFFSVKFVSKVTMFLNEFWIFVKILRYFYIKILSTKLWIFLQTMMCIFWQKEPTQMMQSIKYVFGFVFYSSYIVNIKYILLVSRILTYIDVVVPICVCKSFDGSEQRLGLLCSSTRLKTI